MYIYTYRHTLYIRTYTLCVTANMSDKCWSLHRVFEVRALFAQLNPKRFASGLKLNMHGMARALSQGANQYLLLNRLLR